MNRGDVILVRFPHPSGVRGKKRPAVVVQADAYAGAVSTLVVSEVTKNLTMAGDPACLFVDVSSPEGKASGLIHSSVVSCLLLATVDADTVANVLGTLSPTMKQKLDDCLKAVLGLPWPNAIVRRGGAMRLTTTLAVLAGACVLVPTVLMGQLQSSPAPGGGGDRPAGAAAEAADARFTPYAADPEHPWNRLHQALFVRALDGVRHVHATDPLLYRGGTYLLEGEPHKKAIALLDQLLARPDDRLIEDPLKRRFFQHDLWAAFDYAGWYPDEWVFKSKYEPAAIAVRNRLAKVIGRVALDLREIAALPDNYAQAVRSRQYAAAYDLEHPERPFLPPDLFDPKGPWVRFHDETAAPMAQRHFEGAGGRAVHVIFLRLPGGRTATEQYLKEVCRQEPFLEEAGRHSVKQFPAGTMVAMVRRALTVDRSAKVRVTPVTELVQIRVYRRIPKDPEAHRRGDSGEQDVYEFLLDRAKLFTGQHGLRALGPGDPAEPFFERSEGRDPFERLRSPLTPGGPQLKTCIECHRAPGVYSVLSMERGLRQAGAELFRTYDWDAEMSYTVGAKVKQRGWGLLQGKLEGG